MDKLIAPPKRQCAATTTRGHQCKLNCRPDDTLCYVHARLRDYPPPLTKGKKRAFKQNKNENKTETSPLVATSPECNACFEPFSSERPRVSCGSNPSHDVCPECLGGYIRSTIGQTHSIECMMDNADKCGGRYADRDVMAVVDEATFKKYLEIRTTSEWNTMSRNVDNFQLCPHCAMYGVVAEDIHYVVQQGR